MCLTKVENEYIQHEPKVGWKVVEFHLGRLRSYFFPSASFSNRWREAEDLRGGIDVSGFHGFYDLQSALWYLGELEKCKYFSGIGVVTPVQYKGWVKTGVMGENDFGAGLTAFRCQWMRI